MTTGAPHGAVHQHYLQALARRAATQEGAVRALLEVKLRAARSGGADAVVEDAAAEDFVRAVPPAASAPISQGDATRLLAGLNQHIRDSRQSQGTGRELRSANLFRQSWARLAADDRVDQALARSPDNAGPLNPHGLVVRSLALMRELSPDYLQQFLVQADTLLWLEQEVREAAAAAKPPKRKPARK